MPRIVFMGTPQFAVSSLEACQALGQVVAVVTQPDKPKGRGQEVQVSPVKAHALAHGIPVLQPVKIRGTPFAQELAAFRADVAVVTAYGKILPADVLATPKHGCLNVHASLLPRFRGAAPIQWALLEGDAKTGVCLMQMDEGMDTGPVLARAETDILPTDTYATLHDRLALLGGTLLREHLGAALDGKLLPKAQATEGIVMAPMIQKEHGRLDFSKPAVVLERRVRAFTPWPGAFTTLSGKLLKVHKACVSEGQGAPGLILSASADGVDIATGEGVLRVTSLQLEGKRVMTSGEFIAGHKLAGLHVGV